MGDFTFFKVVASNGDVITDSISTTPEAIVEVAEKSGRKCSIKSKCGKYLSRDLKLQSKPFWFGIGASPVGEKKKKAVNVKLYPWMRAFLQKHPDGVTGAIEKAVIEHYKIQDPDKN